MVNRDDQLVHVYTHSGHRKGYQTLFSELLGLTTSTGALSSPRRLYRILKAKYVLFATIDDGYVGSLMTCVLRSLLGKQTDALFLCPQTAFLPGLRYTLKRRIFSAARKLPRFSLLTIIPFHLRPEYARVANGWIFDPELWDLSVLPDGRIPGTKLSQRLLDEADKRPVLAYIGKVSQQKGFDHLLSLLNSEPDFSESILVVIAGLADEHCKTGVQSLEMAGARVVNRYLDEDEIISLYSVADYVWCAYAPSYDQASGIFGRAVQTGVTAIVRRGAIIHEQAKELGVRYTAIAPETNPRLTQVCSVQRPQDLQTRINTARLAEQALQVLKQTN